MCVKSGWNWLRFWLGLGRGEVMLQRAKQLNKVINKPNKLINILIQLNTGSADKQTSIFTEVTSNLKPFA